MEMASGHVTEVKCLIGVHQKFNIRSFGKVTLFQNFSGCLCLHIFTSARHSDFSGGSFF